MCNQYITLGYYMQLAYNSRHIKLPYLLVQFTHLYFGKTFWKQKLNILFLQLINLQLACTFVKKKNVNKSER